MSWERSGSDLKICSSPRPPPSACGKVGTWKCVHLGSRKMHKRTFLRPMYTVLAKMFVGGCERSSRYCVSCASACVGAYIDIFLVQSSCMCSSIKPKFHLMYTIDIADCIERHRVVLSCWSGEIAINNCAAWCMMMMRPCIPADP